jgi:membrane-associated protease RseP (regulator of RpoE activity)
VVLENWQQGLVFMACLLGILLTHEMGHFLATVWYRVPASFPYVIPLPFTPLGTLGAVISMDARRADRKQTFDIGLAGPLAGLVVAVPILIWGIMQLDLTTMQLGPIRFKNGLLIELIMRWVQPPGFIARWQGQTVSLNQLNPYFMAGWAGMLITGLNMLPVSQLDGGHVIYTLFGPMARWIARGFMVFAVLWCVNGEFAWVLMLLLVFMIGVDHPPTRDDRVPIGWFRFGLGIVSLVIPVLCFVPVPFTTP